MRLFVYAVTVDFFLFNVEEKWDLNNMFLPDGMHVTVLQNEIGGISAFMTRSGRTEDAPILSAAVARMPQSAGGECTSTKRLNGTFAERCQWMTKMRQLI